LGFGFSILSFLITGGFGLGCGLGGNGFGAGFVGAGFLMVGFLGAGFGGLGVLGFVGTGLGLFTSLKQGISPSGKLLGVNETLVRITSSRLPKISSIKEPVDTVTLNLLGGSVFSLHTARRMSTWPPLFSKNFVPLRYQVLVSRSK